MIYTPKMREAVKGIPIPHDFVVDIIEYDMYPPYLGLRFYESHWRYFSESERLRCISYLDRVKRTLEAFGVNVTIDPVYDMPGTQKWEKSK